jgi:putative NADH-flavin reductase
MKITVVGATGRTGRHLLAEGGRRGHQMTAFTRRPQALDGPAVLAALAAVVNGDGRDPQAVRKAIDGAEAVISTIAGGTRQDPHRLANTTQVLIQAMADLGVPRLVVTSAYPSVVDQPPLAMALLRRLLVTPYADNVAMEQLVAASGLDWTIVRLNRLTNKAAAGKVHTSRGLLAKPHAIARADAAATLLDIVADPTLARTAINVAGE